MSFYVAGHKVYEDAAVLKLDIIWLKAIYWQQSISLNTMSSIQVYRLLNYSPTSKLQIFNRIFGLLRQSCCKVKTQYFM